MLSNHTQWASIPKWKSNFSSGPCRTSAHWSTKTSWKRSRDPSTPSCVCCCTPPYGPTERLWLIFWGSHSPSRLSCCPPPPRPWQRSWGLSAIALTPSRLPPTEGIWSGFSGSWPVSCVPCSPARPTVIPSPPPCFCWPSDSVHLKSRLILSKMSSTRAMNSASWTLLNLKCS